MIDSIKTETYPAPYGWDGYVMIAPNGMRREIEINQKQAASDPKHTQNILDCAKKEFVEDINNIENSKMQTFKIQRGFDARQYWSAEIKAVDLKTAIAVAENGDLKHRRCDGVDEFQNMETLNIELEDGTFLDFRKYTASDKDGNEISWPDEAYSASRSTPAPETGWIEIKPQPEAQVTFTDDDLYELESIIAIRGEGQTRDKLQRVVDKLRKQMG